MLLDPLITSVGAGRPVRLLVPRSGHPTPVGIRRLAGAAPRSASRPGPGVGATLWITRRRSAPCGSACRLVRLVCQRGGRRWEADGDVGGGR